VRRFRSILDDLEEGYPLFFDITAKMKPEKFSEKEQ
jgi:hypothetical protein